MLPEGDYISESLLGCFQTQSPPPSFVPYKLSLNNIEQVDLVGMWLVCSQYVVGM